jgi:futalosine hydrolase
MKYFAILSSMPFESEKVLALIKKVRTGKVAGKTVYSGQLSGHDVLLITSGLGKVNAAQSSTCLIENYPVNCVINIGVGGAYPGAGLKIGDVAIATKEIYGDEGVITSKGWDSLKKIGIPLVQDRKKKYFNEFLLADSLLARSVRLAIRHLCPPDRQASLVTRSGPFITVSAATGTRKRALELEKRFNAICENMEGAAIAQVCTIYKIPMIEIRGISNIVGERDKRTWDLGTASENCQDLVLKILCQEKIYNKRACAK